MVVRIDPPEWTAFRTSEGPWVAQCPPLGLAIECDSLEDIQQDAEDATDLLIADLVETGDWLEFFRERKVPFRFFLFPRTGSTKESVEKAAEESPRYAKETPNYNVPISLVIQKQSHDQSLRDHP